MYTHAHQHTQVRTFCVSPARKIKIARLLAFDDLKHLNLFELLFISSFLIQAKQCEDMPAKNLQLTIQSKFGSRESDPFAYIHKIILITTTTGNINTLIILNIGTDRSEQTVQTQIRLLLMEQSDQGLLCLLFCLHLLNTILHCKIQLFQL